MESGTYRFEFEPSVSVSDAEMTVQLARLSIEGLFGEARVRLETRYDVDEAERAINVSGCSEVTTALVRVYTGLLNREIGESAFRVRHERAAAETVASHG